MIRLSHGPTSRDRDCPLPLPFFPPRRIALPISSHDAADRLDRVDDLGEAELNDLRTHGGRILVGTGWL